MTEDDLSQLKRCVLCVESTAQVRSWLAGASTNSEEVQISSAPTTVVLPAEVDWMTMTKMANALIDILTVHTKLTQHDDL